jgi:putative zinc finger/helix-turn-helix YgiT family protein
MKTCPLCGGEVRRERLPAYEYTESGLPNIVLEGVHRVRCVACEDFDGVEIPAVEKLHRAIAHLLVHAAKRLTGAEIRFLRTFLGWSGKTFAGKLHVAPETVSRWEKGAQPMDEPYERLLRLYAAEGQHDCEYSVADTERIEATRTEPRGPLKLKARGKKGWKSADGEMACSA